MAAQPEDRWPDALVLLGDQVYADELSPPTRRWLGLRRGTTPAAKPAPRDQVRDAEDYARLYAESWSDPQVRWLLSTIPSSTVFDDHEVIDDWNTSAAWRRRVTATDWWAERIGGGLASYWVHQHLGNLSPQELAEDPTWQAVLGLDGEDAGPLLRAMAERADTEPGAVSWSYVRHWGTARMVVVDSRAGRVLDEQRRRMLGDAEFDWVEACLARAAADGVQHLVVGTSLPWLLPHAVDAIERWDATLVARHEGRPLGRFAESLRQAADLEHWAAFEHSFDRLGRILTAVARGEHGPAPATALVLSGDVHHAYAAELVSPAGLTSRVHQLTVSPLHNQAPHPIRVGFRLGWSRWARAATAGVARAARVRRTPIGWRKEAGRSSGTRSASWCSTGPTPGSSSR